MRFVARFVLAFVAMLALAHCASHREQEGDDGDIGSTRAALCAAEWSPTWRQGSGANEWWIEYEIGGGTVASAFLEIPGVRNVPLASHYGKWAASTARIPAGTQVVLHASTTSGADAQTIPFGYLAQTTPTNDTCGGGGGGGGTACFAPTFAQRESNEWWVEYAISGDVASAYFQVVGGERVNLTFEVDEWRGKPTNRIPTGASVFLHAESRSGQIGESQTFRFLVDTAPVAKPCGSTPPPPPPPPPPTGCTFNPTWQQGTGANEWWVEYHISGSPRSASFHVVGGAVITLTQAFDKWRGQPSARIPAGTSVFLRAESTSGAIAETNAFRFLVDTQPATKGCTSGGGGGSADVTVSAVANTGPHGRSAPVRVDRRVYGMNIADWRPEDYSPSIRPAFGQLLSALRPGVLRWPAGHRSQEYRWERGGSGQWGDWVLTPQHVEAFLTLARSVGAEPLIAINVKRSTPAAAADLVRYLNVERGHGVRWFQIGNEPDLTDNMTAGPEAYARQLITWSDAMRAVDPNVRLVGPELLTGVHINGAVGTRNWLGPILANAPGRLSAVSWHYYPLDSGQPDPRSSATLTRAHLFQEHASDWPPAGLGYADEIMPELARMVGSTNMVWITEFAEDPGPAAGASISDTILGALWVADALGRYLEYGPGAIVRWLFKGSSSHAYALVNDADQPRPSYGATWLYARHFGDSLVQSSSTSRESVSIHASTSADGALSVMLANKTTGTRRVRVNVSGMVPRSALAWKLTAGGDTKTFFINGTSLNATTATNDIPGTALAAASMFDVEMPAESISVIRYQP